MDGRYFPTPRLSPVKVVHRDVQFIAMAKRLNISDARKLLPALFDRVTNREGEKVIISRRDSGTEAILVSKSYVERLEGRASRKPFRLFGSAKVMGSVEEILGE